jgi:hypothetical protein
MVGRAHHRTHRGVREAEAIRFPLERGKGVGMNSAAPADETLGCRYWPMVSMSIRCPRMSRITAYISSSVSPDPP